MKNGKPANRNPWFWVPSLYYAEGIPYVIVMLVSVIMYKRLGISNTDIALYTSWLYLPWVIKPLWSPIVDLLKTKRFWIVIMQLLVGAGLAGVALTIPVPDFFQYTLAFLWLLAFSSATHDIAADGFYMLGLNENQQAFFVGIRSTFYRAAMITGQGLLVIIAGYIESTTGLPPVEMTVAAEPNKQVYEVFNPDSISSTPMDGELRIIIEEADVDVAAATISNSKADSLISFAKTWNITHDFYEDEAKKAEEKKEADGGPSWWSRYIATPLERFLRDNFGEIEEQTTTSDRAGNVKLVYLHLSNEPPDDETIDVNFGREKGNRSISLVEGTRFRFTKNNWNVPALAAIQLDPKLDFHTTATFEARAGNVKLAWVVTFTFLAILFGVFFIYHRFMLPYPAIDKPATRKEGEPLLKEFFNTFVLFFKKKNIGIIIAFLLLYRLGESQLVKLASPFLLDAREVGGLALTTGEVGFIYGTVGVGALIVGGILGGYLASKNGLKYWLWPMLIAINIPNTVYIYLSYVMPTSFFTISTAVAIEQLGYGFGFTAYMLFMIYVSDGAHKTSHFAITTGFMALGMMIPGMISGWLQDIVGYQHFFVWVVLATIPAFIITAFVKIDPEFGKKKERNANE